MTDLPPGYGEISTDDWCNTCGAIGVRHGIPTCRHYAPAGPLDPEWRALDGATRLADMSQDERAAHYARKYVKDETAARRGAA